MDSELYTIVSMAARYWFAALMLILVFRAWRVTTIDNRRARVLRDWTPETGCIGQFVITTGEKRKRTVKLPIPREGMLGSSPRADVLIRSRELNRYHAHIEQREGGVLLRLQGNARATLNGKDVGDTLFLRDGDVLGIGRMRLTTVLFDPSDMEPTDPPVDPMEEDPFLDEDLLWGEPEEFTKKEKAWPEKRKSTPRK